MKKLIFMLTPVLILLLAFRPVTSEVVTGTVLDNSGNPIHLAKVSVKNKVESAVTDTKGEFKIKVPSTNATLVIEAVGFDRQEMKLAGQKSVIVILQAEEKELEEVVVVSGIHNKKFTTEYKADRQLAGSAPGLYVQPPQPRLPLPTGYYRPSDHVTIDYNREGYDAIHENGFLKSLDNPLSTFSIDVDAASYSNVRRFLNSNTLPPAGAVRIEEMVNYFTYSYPQPQDDKPFSINTEVADAPWNKDHKLVLIGLQGKTIPVESLPASNLVFLIDVSGSMNGPDRLGLVQASMKLLTAQLREQDRISIVVYAGAAGLVLKPTSGSNKTAIREAIDRLSAGGSTAGGEGLRLAYKTAKENFMKEGNNRVILCTDGDFNVGESSNASMEKLIEEERTSGVFLTVLGYGSGNYQDSKMQLLADKGNGNHAYIDGITEAKKVLVNEFGGTLFAIAKDVKLQVEFNPAKVQAYRLIGYENRMLAKEDFNNDKKDAGELGSGHTVTALYEVIPVGVKSAFIKSVDSLKYQPNPLKVVTAPRNGADLLTVKFRYKAPDGDESKLIEHAMLMPAKTNVVSENLRFAAAVAEFGMLLRNSEYKGNSSFDHVISVATKAKGEDREGYRSEFVKLAVTAKLLSNAKNESIEKAGEGSW